MMYRRLFEASAVVATAGFGLEAWRARERQRLREMAHQLATIGYSVQHNIDRDSNHRHPSPARSSLAIG